MTTDREHDDQEREHQDRHREHPTKTVLRSSLGILATATATHGTGRDGDIPLPRLPGFVESAFSPLAYEAARRCLAEQPGGRLAYRGGAGQSDG